MKNESKDKDLALPNIVDYVLLRSSYIKDISFFHGKMGLVVTLYFYAEKYNDDALKEYAWELFQQVYNGIHSEMPLGLENGLVGIAYGVTILRKHNLVDCVLNDVIGDIDDKIMKHDIRRIDDFSLRSGISGLLLYIRERQLVEPITSFDNLYFNELQSVISNKNVSCPRCSLIDILTQPTFSESEYIEKPLDIDGGSSFYVLKSVLA